MEEREMKLLARIGQLNEELDGLRQRFKTVVSVFAEVVSGECDISRIMVNKTDLTVVWAPPGERPSLPPTTNGLPVCVVAPEKPA